MCSRELSPVRWCDQEVDGVYLGRSGWVQVQQRSLDDNRRTNYSTSINTSTTSSLPQYRRPGIKLADYHCNSEPGKMSELNRSLELQRPAYLPLKTRDIEYASTTTSPQISIPESFSPPPITPIISPPPAFQDRIKTKPRTVYGKPPFLPRSDAIVDSDIISPPTSPPPPPINWTTLPEGRQIQSGINLARRTKLTPSPVSAPSYRQQSRIPQTKSLEEATNRRSQFLQRYKDSSSSSSSSLGFRSLDSCVSRPVMPRLAEHGSIDMYEDADEEDNNSSSLNLSNVSSIILNSSPDSVVERSNLREKTSPSSRSTRMIHYRAQSHRSPSSSDANKQVTCSSPSSSSSSSSGFPIRSPSNSGNAFRRSAPTRQHTTSRATQDDLQRVRRSRSLQLPEKRSPGSAANVIYREQMRVSPQQPTAMDAHRVGKLGNSVDRAKKSVQTYTNEELDEEMLREAEVVTEFLYGSRSRAAAKALLLHRYYDRREDIPKEQPKQQGVNNGYNFYVVGNNKPQRQKPLQRGSTAPNLPHPGQSFTPSPTTEKNPCNSSTCDFWPHCAQRDNLNSQAQNVYASSVKVSPSYPRSPQSDQSSRTRDSTPESMKKRNGNINSARASPESKSGSYYQRRPPTPSDRPMSADRDRERDRDDSEVSVQYVRELSVGRRPTSVMSSLSSRDVSTERKTSPVIPKSSSRSPSAIGNSSCSSSSSDIWITTSDRTVTKSPRNIKSSGASTPMDDHTVASSTKSDCQQPREMILTRPGSAPVNVEEERARASEFQKRSMSLPKSFLSGRNKQRYVFPPLLFY